MDGRRAPQGLDAEDRIALGLTAPRLFYLLIFSMSGWGLLSSPLPLVLRAPPAALLLATGGALAWGRVGGRPLDRWAVLYAAFLVRPRRSAPASKAGAVAAMTPQREAEPENLVSLPLPGLRSVHRARRVAFFSLRGGTGKSTLASEIAAGVAAGVLGGYGGDEPRVALLDLDLRASTLRISMGLLQPTLTLSMEMGSAGPTQIERALLRHESGARVLLAPRSATSQDGLNTFAAEVLAYLDQQEYDLVLIDLASGIDELGAFVLEVVDDIFCVFTASAPGVFSLYRDVEALRRLGHRQKISYVANLHDPGVDLAEVMGDLRGTLAASIPKCAALSDCAEGHRTAVLEDLPAADALQPLALSVMGDVARRPAAWGQVVLRR